MTQAELARLQNLFETEDRIAFAILFGSAASGRETAESDVDIGAYFRPRREDPREIDIEEEDAEFESEHELWRACEEALGVNVDFVVLNRAPATVAAAAVLTGRLLAVNDGRLYRRFFNEVTTLAEDFRELVEDFRRIRSRAASLSRRSTLPRSLWRRSTGQCRRPTAVLQRLSPPCPHSRRWPLILRPIHA